MTYTELQNSPELTLAVHFVGEADQVTQLFPQNILRGMGYPLDIQVILTPGSDYVTYTELQNSPELTLAVHFVGEADQVTQLFPQNILRGMGYPLDIQVILKVGLQWSRGHVREI